MGPLLEEDIGLRVFFFFFLKDGDCYGVFDAVVNNIAERGKLIHEMGELLECD